MLPAAAAQEVAEYLLREELGFGPEAISKGVVSSETLLLLLRADCRTKKDVRALSTEVLTALPPAAAAEVKQYLVLLLRKSLGRLSGIILSDATLLGLVEAGCRTRPDVWTLGAEVVVALPAAAAGAPAAPEAIAAGIITSSTPPRYAAWRTCSRRPTRPSCSPRGLRNTYKNNNNSNGTIA